MYVHYYRELEGSRTLYSGYNGYLVVGFDDYVVLFYIIVWG